MKSVLKKFREAGLKINDIGNGIIFVTSKYDEWRIDEMYDSFIVFHKNRSGSLYHKHKYRYKSLNHALHYIKVHDGKYHYKTNLRYGKLYMLIEQVSKERKKNGKRGGNIDKIS